MKKCAMILQLVFCFLVMSVPAQALPRFDEDARDMLRSSEASSNLENENQDKISKWSDSRSSEGVMRTAPSIAVARPFEPISDSSFEVVQSRGPASVSENASGRSPAGKIIPVAKVEASDMNIAPQALIRALQKKKAYQEVSIIANDLGFFPTTVFVTQGIPVRLFVTGASTRSQCFMLDSFGVRRQIRSQKIEEIQFTPDQTGTFTFNCPMNGAKGTVIVKDLDVNRVPASIITPTTEE